jgi:uncharacterized protein YbdZ (MbtH family)
MKMWKKNIEIVRGWDQSENKDVTASCFQHLPIKEKKLCGKFMQINFLD